MLLLKAPTKYIISISISIFLVINKPVKRIALKITRYITTKQSH